MGKNDNFAIDEESTRRACEWLTNGARKRGIKLYFMCGKTLNGWVLNGEVPADDLGVITAAIIAKLADNWIEALKNGDTKTELDRHMAAIVCAANLTLRAYANCDNPDDILDEIFANGDTDELLAIDENLGEREADE